MNKESIELIIKYLNELSDKLTPFAKNIFSIYARQSIADGICNLILAFISLFIAIKAFCLLNNYLKDDEMGEDKLFSVFISTIISTFPFVFGISKIMDGVKYLINPYYYAIQNLLRIIK